MMLRNMNEVKDFMNLINNSNGDVWVEDEDGSRFDLKSQMGQNRVADKLVSDNDLELYASDKNTEIGLISFLMGLHRNHGAAAQEQKQKSPSYGYSMPRAAAFAN